MKTYFPQLDPRALASLLTIKSQLDVNPDYLSDDNCPYDDMTREDLTKILAPKVVEKVIEVEKIVEKRIEIAAEGKGKRGPKSKVELSDEIAAELKDIREDLKQLKIDGRSLQPSDKIAILKTRSVLLEKLVMLAEKSTNIKRVNIFMSTVMTILDDLVEPDMRQEFMRRIEQFAEKE
jgi:hypothetical protein